MHIKTAFVAAGALMLAACHTPMPQDVAATPAEQFELLKSLEGTWESFGGEAQGVQVVYKVTAAGSAVHETIFGGTPHEMVTVYHMNGDALEMTHYCAMGNQPHMVAQPATSADSVAFVCVGASNISSEDAPHMHAGRLTLTGADTLESAWDTTENGEVKTSVSFQLRRASH